MTEQGPQNESPSMSVVDRVGRGIDRIVRPASTARMEQFTKIIAVLPEGALKKSYQDMQPKLHDMLKIQDLDILTGEVFMRAFASVWGGGAAFFGSSLIAMGAGIAAPPLIPIAAATGIAAGVGLLWPYGPIARERKSIANETTVYKEFYTSPAGKDAAKMWDKLPGNGTDQIVRAIIFGTPSMRGAPGSVVPMPPVPGVGGFGR